MEDKSSATIPNHEQGENYLRSLIDREASVISTSLQSKLDPSQDGGFSKSALEELSLIIASLSARTTIIEQALEQQLTPYGLDGYKHLLGELNLAATDVVSEASFHDLEMAEDGGQFAWTKTKDLTFYLPLSRARNKWLILTAIAVIDPAYIRRFECAVDDQSLRCRTSMRAGEIRVCVRVPASDDVGVSKVVFSLPGVKTPEEAAGSTDTRTLGFAFKSLEVKTQPLLRDLLGRVFPGLVS